MPNFLNTNKLIVLAYPPGAGGKLVANCLSLSGGVMPMLNPPARRWEYMQQIVSDVSTRVTAAGGDLEQIAAALESLGAQTSVHSSHLKFDIGDWPYFVLSYYRRFGDQAARLNWINTTLPADETSLSRWTELELIATALYGFRLPRAAEKPPDYFDCPVFRTLDESGLYHFSVLHRQQNVNVCRILFPNSIQVRLINTERWIEHCLSLGKTFGQSGYFTECERSEPCIDFDTGSVFTRDGFLKEMENLYHYLQLDDFPPDLITEFHERYLAVYNAVPA